MAKVLDLHIHSVFSIDSPVQPEEYIIHLLELRRKYRIDGLVFCEHRRFVWDLDYQALGEKYGVLVFAGVEAETRWGHILVYCPDLNWMSRVDFSRKFDPIELAEEVNAHRGIIVPAHPFRGMISLGEKVRKLPHLYALEVINASNLPEENQRAELLARELGLAGTGGSDAHYLEELGTGLTEFERDIKSLEEMIFEIKAGRIRALTREQVKI